MKKKCFSKTVWQIFAFVTILSVVALSGFGAINAASKQVTTVRVGYMSGTSSSSCLAIADKLGYFKKNHIKIDGKKFLTGVEAFQAMQAGDLDVIDIGPGATHLAAKGLGTIIMLDCLGMSDYIVTYKGSGVSTVKDLKDKVVGIPKGTSSEMILNLALEKNGMSQKDLKDGSAANIAASGIVSAIVAKQVAAIGTWVTYGEEIKKLIGADNFVILAKSRDFYPDYIFPGSWVARNKFLEENPKIVADFLKSMLRASDFRAKNREETCKITSQFDGSDFQADLVNYDNTKWLTAVELKQAYKDGSILKWYEKLEKMFVEIGIMKEFVPADKFVNTKAMLGVF